MKCGKGKYLNSQAQWKALLRNGGASAWLALRRAEEVETLAKPGSLKPEKIMSRKPKPSLPLKAVRRKPLTLQAIQSSRKRNGESLKATIMSFYLWQGCAEKWRGGIHLPQWWYFSVLPDERELISCPQSCHGILLALNDDSLILWREVSVDILLFLLSLSSSERNGCCILRPGCLACCYPEGDLEKWRRRPQAKRKTSLGSWLSPASKTKREGGGKLRPHRLKIWSWNGESISAPVLGGIWKQRKEGDAKRRKGISGKVWKPALAEVYLNESENVNRVASFCAKAAWNAKVGSFSWRRKSVVIFFYLCRNNQLIRYLLEKYWKYRRRRENEENGRKSNAWRKKRKQKMYLAGETKTLRRKWR